jgi:hypothetical protein
MIFSNFSNEQSESIPNFELELELYLKEPESKYIYPDLYQLYQ